MKGLYAHIEKHKDVDFQIISEPIFNGSFIFVVLKRKDNSKIALWDITDIQKVSEGPFIENGDKLLYSQREKIAKEAMNWCANNGAPFEPVNIIAALNSLGYSVKKLNS